jgi:hypothetical protein
MPGHTLNDAYIVKYITPFLDRQARLSPTATSDALTVAHRRDEPETEPDGGRFLGSHSRWIPSG